MVIIDDFSSDGTAAKIKELILKKNLNLKKFKLIQNYQRRKAMINQYYAMHKHCKKGEVVMVIDGDDEIVGTQVFSLYNTIYQSKRANFVYSNYLHYMIHG